MVKCKSTVEPPIVILQAAITNAYWMLFHPLPGELLISSAHDGEHMEGSRHYDYAALDVRSKSFRPADKLKMVKAVITRLGTPVVVETATGPGYQTRNGKWLGILEFEGQAREHFHFERN